MVQSTIESRLKSFFRLSRFPVSGQSSSWVMIREIARFMAWATVRGKLKSSQITLSTRAHLIFVVRE